MSEQLFREALENTRLAMRGELGIGATDEALLWAEQSIATLERSAAIRDKIIEELESRLAPKQCGECHLKPNEICDICGAMGGVE